MQKSTSLLHVVADQLITEVIVITGIIKIQLLTYLSTKVRDWVVVYAILHLLNGVSTFCISGG
jgi:hypothetical protein